MNSPTIAAGISANNSPGKLRAYGKNNCKHDYSTGLRQYYLF
ncbi:hypothetical protein [Butyrivibrio sp. WCD2001]|nr:hypothetical protein [Butyrivibrio sp. WCD2001]